MKKIESWEGFDIKNKNHTIHFFIFSLICIYLIKKILTLVFEFLNKQFTGKLKNFLTDISDVLNFHGNSSFICKFI